MRKTHKLFHDVAVGTLFLTSSETLPEDELYEKTSRDTAHQLSLPGFDRVGGEWRFQKHHVVMELVSEYAAPKGC